MTKDAETVLTNRLAALSRIIRKPVTNIPVEFHSVKKGNWLTVKREMFNRGGQQGLVVDDPNDVGVSLDFFTCGQCGRGHCPCYTSIEFWEWGELES